MTHPSEADLALLSGGDLGYWQAWLVRRHVGHCDQCKAALHAFEKTREGVRELAAEMPKDVNWNRLAVEMTGNIRVGLAAGQAIARFDRAFAPPKSHRLGWHAALVLAASFVIVAIAFSIGMPRQQSDHLISALRGIRLNRIGTLVKGHALPVSSDDIVLEASHSSIQVSENGGALSLMHPHSDGLTVSINMQGSAGVRFVDADTGQVLINRVYDAHQ